MRSPLAGWKTMFGTLIASNQAIAIYYQTYRVDYSFLNAKKVLNKGVLSTVEIVSALKISSVDLILSDRHIALIERSDLNRINNKSSSKAIAHPPIANSIFFTLVST